MSACLHACCAVNDPTRGLNPIWGEVFCSLCSACQILGLGEEEEEVVLFANKPAAQPRVANMPFKWRIFPTRRLENEPDAADRN